MFDADPVPVFAHMVVARAVLEPAARAKWLLDPTVGIEGRIARGLANRVTDLRPIIRLGLQGEEGKPTPEDQLSEILARAQERGFARWSKKGNVVLNKPVPGYGALVKLLFEGTAFGDENLPALLYSYYSAVVHGELHGLLESTLRDQMERNPFRDAVSVPTVTKSAGVVTAMAIGSYGYIEAVDQQIGLLGWGTAEWTAARLDALRAITEALPSRT